MDLSARQIARYQTLIDGLDPQGAPQAQFVYRPRQMPAHPARTVAVLDASYNPMTLAHERLALRTQEALKLDEIVLMLARANVDKEMFGAALGQRLAMIVGYAETQAQISVVGCSHARFTEKARALSACYPPATQFYFIMGYDTLVRLFAPRYYANMAAELGPFFKKSHVVAANRENQNRRAVEAFFNRPECAPVAHRLHAVELPREIARISSTEVRQRVAQRAPIDDLVPPQIAHSIARLGLYRA